MKRIYWKNLIYNYTIRYWYKFIYCKPGWKHYYCDKRIWDLKKLVEIWASFLPELDDVMRKVTTKDSAITTIVSTHTDQKMYKGGKVIAMKKTT